MPKKINGRPKKSRLPATDRPKAVRPHITNTRQTAIADMTRNITVLLDSIRHPQDRKAILLNVVTAYDLNTFRKKRRK